MTATELQAAAWPRPGLARAARLAVWGLAAAALALLLASIPAYLRTVGVYTEQEQLAASLLGPAAYYSPSPQFEFWVDAAYNSLSFGAAALSLALAALIVWRRPNEPVALAVALMLLAYGVVMAGPLEMLLGQSRAGAPLAYFAQMLLWGGVLFLFCIFPDGRFVPGWTRWFALLLIPWSAGLAVLQLSPFVTANLGTFFMIYTLPSLAAPYAQWVRYRQAASAASRQQVKWVMLGLAGWILAGSLVPGVIIGAAHWLPAPTGQALSPGAAVVVFLARLMWPASLTLLPLALTVAVLRYRLFEIDGLINRALVYGGLSAGVAALYVLVVGGLSALFRTNNNLAPVLLTALAAGLLFQPVRARLQQLVNGLMLRQPAGRGEPAARPEPAELAEPNQPAAALGAPATPGAWDYFFRGLAVLTALEIAALAVDVIATTGGLGLIGQSLFARMWLGLVVGPLLLFMATLIVFRAPGHLTGRFLMLVSIGVVAMQFDFGWRPPGAAALAALVTAWFAAGFLGPCMGYVMLTFPTGRVYPAGWDRPMIAAAALKFIGVLLEILATPGKVRIFAPAINPLFVPALAPYRGLIAATIGISGLLLPVIIVLCAASLMLRYRAAPPRMRQQIKWVVWGFGLMVPTGILTFVTAFLYGANSSAFQVSLLFTAIGQGALLTSIAIGMLRNRLFDIDVLINRTLVYGSLTMIVVAVYVIAVGYLSELFRASGSFVLSLLATGLIAVFFQPVRERLQRVVNRLLYGERDDPYAVLSRLGQRLEAALAPEAVLPAIAETIATALKLPYVAVALQAAGESEAKIAAAYGLRVAALTRLPLSYQGERVGDLLIAARGPGESFSPAERRLLGDIAHEAGVAVHAMRLTADLQRSRERLVTAREEERRRLRRDLHDGLGPQLASQTLTLTAARQLLRQNPEQADALLAEAIKHAQAAVHDIRRVVYDLRPPALDDLGLVGALRAQAAEYEASGMRFSLSVPAALPPLPAAVEVACYRIAQEAMTNVVKHAGARQCRLTLALDGAPASALRIEVADDGRGLPPGRRAGVGLSSMRERAEELGGACQVEAGAAGGTRVSVRLPLG